jgi:hypothetical protein
MTMRKISAIERECASSHSFQVAKTWAERSGAMRTTTTGAVIVMIEVRANTRPSAAARTLAGSGTVSCSDPPTGPARWLPARTGRDRVTFTHTGPSERHVAGSWRSPWKTASTLFPSGSMTNAA